MTSRSPLLLTAMVVALFAGCGDRSGKSAEETTSEFEAAYLESNAELIANARGMIEIGAHNCFPSCQSFSLSLKPSGEARISVFRTFDDGVHRSVRYEGIEDLQVEPPVYAKLRDLIDDLGVASLEQDTPRSPLSCVSKSQPVLTLRSQGQLEHEYWLWLSCDQHREIALQIASAATELTQSNEIVETWPLPERR
jgi:hypothetical protein